MKRNGNVVLVTGGGTGIGLALAVKLLREGNEVIICGRTTSSLEDARRHYPGLDILVADVSSEDGRQTIVEVTPPSVDTAMARGLPGMTPALFAEKVFAQLVNGKNEIVIGASRLAKLLSRLSPQLGVKIMNDGEERNPAYVKA